MGASHEALIELVGEPGNREHRASPRLVQVHGVAARQDESGAVDVVAEILPQASLKLFAVISLAAPRLPAIFVTRMSLRTWVELIPQMIPISCEAIVSKGE